MKKGDRIFFNLVLMILPIGLILSIIEKDIPRVILYTVTLALVRSEVAK